MDGFTMLVGGVLPYITIVVFIVGMAYRLMVWKKTPQPGKMALYPNSTGGSLVGGILKEVFFFPSLFKGDRTLWIFSWVFHAMLALVFLGHVRVFTGIIDSVLISMGVSTAGVTWMSSTFGGAAGIIMLATGALLLIRRFTTERVKQITNFSDFFALFLLLSIIVTGDLMRFSAGAHIDLVHTRAWAVSLLTFSPTMPAAAAGNMAFLVHALLAQLLIMYIPFSKVLHLGGIFFTQALVQRR